MTTWTRNHPDSMLAAAWGRYEIIRYYFGTWQYVVHRDGAPLPSVGPLPDSYPTLAEAKAAAEAHATGLVAAS